jgi:hypothetical protein
MVVRISSSILEAMRSHVVQSYACLSSNRPMFEHVSILLIHVLTVNPDFSNMLNSIRIGIMNPEISATMKNLRRDLSRNEADTTFM